VLGIWTHYVSGPAITARGMRRESSRPLAARHGYISQLAEAVICIVRIRQEGKHPSSILQCYRWKSRYAGLDPPRVTFSFVLQHVKLCKVRRSQPQNAILILSRVQCRYSGRTTARYSIDSSYHEQPRQKINPKSPHHQPKHPCKRPLITTRILAKGRMRKVRISAGFFHCLPRLSKVVSPILYIWIYVRWCVPGLVEMVFVVGMCTLWLQWSCRTNMQSISKAQPAG
jgi:hypothetical protein